MCAASGAARFSGTSSKIAQTVTDADGRAIFDRFPDNATGSVLFQPLPEGSYSSEERITWQPHVGTDDLEARMLQAATFRGVVREADGRPAADLLVWAEGLGRPNVLPCRKMTRTAADGSYRLDVFADLTYMIGMVDDRRAARSLDGIKPSEGETRDGLDLALISGTVVRGRVVREDGTPVAGVSMTLSEVGPAQGSTLPRWATTDADGRYCYRVGPGHHWLGGNYKDGSTLLGTGQSVELVIEAEPEIIQDLTLRPRDTAR